MLSSCLLFLLVVMSGAKPKLGPQRPEETQSVEPAPLFRESGYHKSPLAVSLTHTPIRAACAFVCIKFDLVC